MPAPSTWPRVLQPFFSCFTTPSAALFGQLLTAWMLCPGRHTLTRLWSVMPPGTRHYYGAYARWVRAGRWSMPALWQALLGDLVGRWAAEGPITLLLDDSLWHKTGRHIDGAGIFRDAVHSTVAHVVTALGLNIVVLALRVRPPGGGEPLALPIGLRLHRKGGPSLTALAAEMVREVVELLPDRTFCLVADGAYASLIGQGLPRTTIISRMRRDAALFKLPPRRRPGQRGRPRQKGTRLPTPPELAAQVRHWTRTTIGMRGREVQRDLWARPVLWYTVSPHALVLLVVVRDPTGHEPDDFLVTTDIHSRPQYVASAYFDRWAIEDCFRNTKQFLGAEDPQSWVVPGPERVAALGCWLYSVVWSWFLTTHSSNPPCLGRPWYSRKHLPSFIDALAALRREQWSSQVFGASPPAELNLENIRLLLDVLAEAA